MCTAGGNRLTGTGGVERRNGEMLLVDVIVVAMCASGCFAAADLV